MPSDPADAGFVWALASLGRAMSFTADAGQARAVGEEALAHARKLGDERLLIHALQTMLWHSVVPGGIGRWTAIGDELARLARGSGEWAALGMAAVFQTGFAYMQSDPDAWADASADGDNLANVLVAYAKTEQVTQIVVGSSQRSRWQELIGGGSIVGRVSRLAARAGIDVHIMALREAGR
jgi:nucleotide-binding universal stress UspA family protein